MTAQCEGMGEVGSARYEPALLPPSWRYSMPSMGHLYRWSLAIDGWRIRPLKHKRTWMPVRDRYVAYDEWIQNVLTIKQQLFLFQNVSRCSPLRILKRSNCIKCKMFTTTLVHVNHHGSSEHQRPLFSRTLQGPGSCNNFSQYAQSGHSCILSTIKQSLDARPTLPRTFNVS